MTKVTETAKAAALLAQAEAQAKADAQFVADRDFARTTITAEAERMGGQYAAGKMSLTQLAYLLSDAARHGYVKEADVNDLYRAYAKGNNDAVDAGKITVGNVEYRVSGEKIDGNDKSPINNLKTFARLAAAVHGLEIYEAVIRIRPSIDKDLVAGSEYVCMVRVNRALSKLADEKAYTDAELLEGKMAAPTDDDIRAIMTKEQKEGATFAKKLEDAVNALKTLVKKSDANDLGMRDIYESLVALNGKYVEREKAARDKMVRIGEAPKVPTLPDDAKTTLEAAE